MKAWIIHLLGGYTQREHDVYLVKVNELLREAVEHNNLQASWQELKCARQLKQRTLH